MYFSPCLIFNIEIMTIALIAALKEELDAVLTALHANAHIEEHGRRRFYVGSLHGEPCVAVLSGIGKVAAASTVTALIHVYAPSRIIFTGVAGGLADGLRVGDVVIASELIQHDMNAEPLFPRFEVPMTGKQWFATDEQLAKELDASAQQFVDVRLPGTINLVTREQFGLHHPQVHWGAIASGDQFIASHLARLELQQVLPSVLCVEMEGAAVAQVCAAYQVPFAVMRTISDSADDDAVIDFPRFIDEVASVYSAGILREWVLNARVDVGKQENE